MIDVKGQEIYVGAIVITGQSGGSISLGFGIVTSIGKKMITLDQLPYDDFRHHKSVYPGCRRYGDDVSVL